VSFLTRLFGSPEEKSRLTMRQIAEALAIQNPEIAFDGEGIGSLKAVWKGASLHVRYGEGGIQRCTLRHSFLKHGFDLESDLDRRNEPIEALPDPSSKRSGERDGQAHLGGGLFCDRADLRNFARLPEDLRSRMPQALIKARVCYFRAGNGNFDATFHLDSDNSPGQDHLIRALTLAMEVCEARGILSTPEAQAPVTTAGANVESRVYSPLSVARGCARKMPGATVEDLGGTGREGIWARVSFDHEGCAMRLVFYRFDEFTCAVWLEARAQGKLGEFGVMKFDPSEEAEAVAAVTGDDDDEDRDEDDGDDDEDDGDDDDDESGDEDDDSDEDEDKDDSDAGSGSDEAAAGPYVRIFVGKDLYVDGPRAAAEAAQVLSLPAGVQSALHALVTEAGTVVLKQEVLSLNLGELCAFAEAKEQHRGPQAYPLALGARLAALAAALPPAR
jgi:hypothetical protein